MKNKRAQFMALYLPIITLFMIALVIGMYWIQNSSLDNHMVSPVKVLKLTDDKEIFEIRERSLVVDSAKEVGLDEVDFAEKMKEKFCTSFISADYDKMKDFLFEDMIFQEKKDVNIINQKEFCEAVYDFKFDNAKNVLVLERKDIGKQERLEAIKRDRINFIVDFKWDLSETIEIPKKEVMGGNL